MKPVPMMRAMRRESGVLLLTVALLLAAMAALAVGLNRAAGMDLQSVSAEYDRRSAAYLADAAFAAAKWTNQAKCGDADIVSLPLADGMLNAQVKKSPHQITVTATGTTTTGLARTVTRDKINIYNFGSTETKALGGAVQDTYIYAGQSGAMNTGKSLVLQDQSNALLSWDTKDIPKDSEVLAATLTLVQTGASTSFARTVNLHRVTTQWDASATWTRARPLVGWSGGDYDAQIIAGIDVKASSTYSMDLTTLTDAWYNNIQSNYGVLLRLPNPGQNVTFASREAGPAQQPVLRVTFSKLCP